MTQAPLWIAVALFGVLVGATVPVLFLGRAVDEVAKTLGHVNRSADDVERVTKLLGGLYQNIGRTGAEGVAEDGDGGRRLGGADAERHRMALTKEMS
jgi:hypothetical protein